MFNEKDRQLLIRVLAATQAGKMDWSPTGLEDKFVTALSGKYLVTIENTRLVVGPTYIMTIQSEDGAAIHRLTSEDYAELVELFEFARRRAMRIDDTLDDIIKDLDSES